MKLRILSALMMCLLLCACSPGETPPVSPDTTAAQTEPAAPPATVLAAGGKALYTIIRAEEADQATIELVSKFKKSLGERTNIDFPIGTDWLKKGSEPNAETREILVGDTNHPETAEVLAGLGYEDYAITAVGNKIVIAAHTPANLKKAVNYFLKNYSALVSTGEDGLPSLSLTAEDYYTFHAEYPLTDFMLSGKPLDSYRIVCPADPLPSEKKAAESLRTAIAVKCGSVLPVVADTEPETEAELLIGRTNRAESKEAAGAITNRLSYTWTVKGEKLVLAMGGYAASRAAIDEFPSCYTVSGGKAEIPADLVKNGAAPYESTDRTEGTTLRIMSSNVLFDKVDIPERAEILADTYLLYQPDSIGLQEMIPEWQRALFPLLKDVYSVVPAVTDGAENYTQLIYRTDRYRLIDHGFHRYRTGKAPWSVTWAVLENIETGERYAHCNTHFTIVPQTDTSETNAVEGKQYRLNDGTYLRGLVAELREKYDNLPVVLTGDFNCNTSSDEYANLTKDTDVTSSMLVAPRAELTGSAHSVGQANLNEKSNSAIDHVMLTTSTLEALFHDIVYNDVVIHASDHCPVFADLRLKN